VEARARGFTLVEAMLAVGILGIASAVVMVLVAGYMRRSKAAEGVNEIGIMAQSASAYFDGSDELQPGKRHFPPSSAASVPWTVDLVRGKKFASSPNDWAGTPWKELKFSIEEPQCFAYSFGAGGQGPGARATATAQGDLDGDGDESMFVLAIVPDATNHAAVAATVQKTMPDE
jgi:type II secretory pathway pseudopilin PulG